MNQTASSAADLAQVSAAVHRYRGQRPLYQQLARLLTAWLEERCREVGLHVLVAGRAKDVASFAEKIIRKRYLDPFGQTDDLCGVRVIVNTLGEVHQVVALLQDSSQGSAPLFSVLKDEDK